MLIAIGMVIVPIGSVLFYNVLLCLQRFKEKYVENTGKQRMIYLYFITRVLVTKADVWIYQRFINFIRNIFLSHKTTLSDLFTF